MNILFLFIFFAINVLIVNVVVSRRNRVFVLIVLTGLSFLLVMNMPDTFNIDSLFIQRINITDQRYDMRYNKTEIDIIYNNGNGLEYPFNNYYNKTQPKWWEQTRKSGGVLDNGVLSDGALN